MPTAHTLAHARHLPQGYGLERVADVRGVRVVVETKEQCYEALRAIQVWDPGARLIALQLWPPYASEL